MGPWSKETKSEVAHMNGGDFYSHEKSVTLENATEARIEFVAADGTVTPLKAKLALQAGEIIDGTKMSVKALREFLEAEMQDAKAKGLLFSAHLKATMMKISDPIMFGHVVSVFFKDVFAKNADTFAKLGVNPNAGLGDLFNRVATLSQAEQDAINADFEAAYASRPALAMVNSDKGITSLHVSSDVIIDASMPACIRDSGMMWNAEGKLQEAKAVIPDNNIRRLVLLKAEPDVRNSKPVIRKRIAVIGDMCPIAAPPIFSEAGKPKCSASSCIPRKDRTRSDAATSKMVAIRASSSRCRLHFKGK